MPGVGSVRDPLHGLMGIARSVLPHLKESAGRCACSAHEHPRQKALDCGIITALGGGAPQLPGSA
jgi:hypothetical protein